MPLYAETAANVTHRIIGDAAPFLEGQAANRRYGDESPVYVYEARLRGLMQVRDINDFWTASQFA
jgi:hypothetical protein